MRTQGEAITSKVRDSITEIERLIGISHEEGDFSKLIKIIGGEIEKFLKAIVFQGQTNTNFYNLINNLSNLGVSSDSIQSLHDFRLAYNGYKHDPFYSRNINSVRTLFLNLENAVNEITNKGLGDANQTYNIKSEHLVWFAGWDDYIGGMVECDIFIPDFSADFPYGLEHFNISFDGWDKVTEKYTNSGELKLGKEYVSERAYNAWKAQSDFVNAGAFQGDLSEFVRDLASQTSKREHELISFLKRENDSYSVKAAIVFSLQDSLIQNQWHEKLDLRDEVLLRAYYDYGINLESAYLVNYINKIDFETIVNNRERLKVTDEILWVDEAAFNSQNNLTISQSLNIAQNTNNKIVTRIK